MKPDMGQMRNNMRDNPNGTSPKLTPMRPRTSEYNYTMPGGTIKTSKRGNPNAEGVSEMNSKLDPNFVQSMMGRFSLNNQNQGNPIQAFQGMLGKRLGGNNG